MGTLTTLRRDVAVTLTGAGVPTYDHLPPRLSPPCAILAAAEPYLTRDGAPHGAHRMRLEVRLIAAPGTNETVTDDLDDLIEQAHKAIDATTWAVEEVSQPYNLVIGQASYLAVSLTINDDITL